MVTQNEVADELLQEKSEVKIFATAVFENCPDQVLNEDYCDYVEALQCKSRVSAIDSNRGMQDFLILANLSEIQEKF